MMQEYLVEWYIELDADNPEEAARLAQDIHQDPKSIANVYHVTDTEGNETVVDLEPGPEEVLSWFEEAARDYAFIGAADPMDHEAIEKNYAEARLAIRRLLK